MCIYIGLYLDIRYYNDWTNVQLPLGTPQAALS